MIQYSMIATNVIGYNIIWEYDMISHNSNHKRQNMLKYDSNQCNIVQYYIIVHH